MKQLYVLAALVAVLSCSKAPEVIWREGPVDDNGTPTHTIVIRNAAKLTGDWAIYFTQMKPVKRVLDGSDALICHVNGPLQQIVPLDSMRCRDSLVIRYVDRALRRRSWAPEGFVLHNAGKTIKLKAVYEYLPLKEDGPAMYAWNESLKLEEVNALDIIPQPKNRSCEGERPNGWYRLTLGVEPQIEAQDEDGRFYAEQTLDQIRENLAEGESLPEGTVIEDWPDYQYRGFMLDVSRNFTTKDNLLHIIDLLARYKLNVLHMHLADDEGWRFEVPGIPELTELAAFHSLDESEGLLPSYDCCADPKDLNSLANGYYTRAEFMEILQYAWSRRIHVLPEFDTPGHSRAAIKAMAAYERRTGDSSMRLQDPTDSSVYFSAQCYKDNIMSVGLESVYTFMEYIFDCLIDIYKEAGVPLMSIHMGGDEVPKGSWYGEHLHPYFLGRVAAMAESKKVALSGWQEVAMCKDSQTDDALRRVVSSTFVWNTRRDTLLPYKIAGRDFPVVLSNVEYTYADQAYNAHMCEQAHDWAHFIDDVRAFNFPIMEHPNVIGVQCQMFTETVRSFEDLCYDIFPKSLGVYERAWNRVPEQSVGHFYSTVIAHEMPLWEREGIRYHIPQPGMKIVDGNLVTNHVIPGAKVKVTEDADRYYAVAEYGSWSSCPTVIVK